MSKRKIGATIVLLVIVAVFGFGAFKLVQFWQWRESKREDRVGYIIVLESEGARNVVLRVPTPYKDGTVMTSIIDNLEQKPEMPDVVTIEDKKLAKNIIDTEHGEMLEVRLEELKGRFWLEGLVVDKKHQMIAPDDDGLNMWLSPYYYEGKRIPDKSDRRVQFGGDGKRETYIYATYDGEPIFVERIGFDIGEDMFIGTRHFSFSVAELSLSNNGWQIVPLHEWGTTSY